MKSEMSETGAGSERWVLIRDIIVFQCKLIVDGFRDLLFLPLSLAAGLMSLFGKGPDGGNEFYDLLRLGRRSERYINLFGALDREAPLAADDGESAERNLDEIVARVESFLLEEYRKGGVTAQAKQRMDAALDRLQGKPGRRDQSQ